MYNVHWVEYDLHYFRKPEDILSLCSKCLIVAQPSRTSLWEEQIWNAIRLNIGYNKQSPVKFAKVKFFSAQIGDMCLISG